MTSGSLMQKREAESDPLGEFRVDLSRVFCPRWPLLAEASAIAAHHPEGPRGMRAAWEACAIEGLIPTSWVGDPSRSFAIPTDRVLGWREHGIPSTRRALTSIAADAGAVATAERLLDQFEAAARPWLDPRHSPPCSHTAFWWVGSFVQPNTPVAIAGDLWDSVQRAFFDAREGERLHEIKRAAKEHLRGFSCAVPGALGDDLLTRRMEHDMAAAAGWRTASLLGLHAQRLTFREGGALDEIERVPLATQPNPFAALVGLWDTGYGPGSALSERARSFLSPAWKMKVSPATSGP